MFSLFFFQAGQQITLGSTNFLIQKLFTIILIFLIIFCYGIYYSHSLNKSNSYDDLKKLPFLTFLFIQWINKLTYQILGKKFLSAAPLFIYIILYFWISSLLSLLGLPNLGTAIEITSSLAIFVFIATVACGIYYKRASFFDDYCFWIKVWKNKYMPFPDPLKLIGELSKIISLSCRLWGNSIAGSLILLVCHKSINLLTASFSASWMSIFFIPSFVFPFHIYFDVIEGFLQAFIFMILTISYLSLATKKENIKINYQESK